MATAERVTVQVKTVGSVDIDAERTRVYFAPHELTGTIDSISFLGMNYALVPGTRVRVTVEIVDNEVGT